MAVHDDVAGERGVTAMFDEVEMVFEGVDVLLDSAAIMLFAPWLS